MQYVDGFVVPVPKKKLQAYRRIGKKAGKIWREYGALDYRECIADDVKVGKVTSFPRSVKLKSGETVAFSWIVYKSRAQRDRVNAKVMADPRLKEMMESRMPPSTANACSMEKFHDSGPPFEITLGTRGNVGRLWSQGFSVCCDLGKPAPVFDAFFGSPGLC